ncbi:uncharacterized protein [Rutidosis leptorrhynchoides]|uniref:uncharacterized protein isoform X2 n=1 Tax=Rutidosis leptorrhynchoides TaxID=125765 RepID=UPI003A98E67C
MRLNRLLASRDIEGFHTETPEVENKDEQDMDVDEQAHGNTVVGAGGSGDTSQREGRAGDDSYQTDAEGSKVIEPPTESGSKHMRAKKAKEARLQFYGVNDLLSIPEATTISQFNYLEDIKLPNYFGHLSPEATWRFDVQLAMLNLMRSKCCLKEAKARLDDGDSSTPGALTAEQLHDRIVHLKSDLEQSEKGMRRGNQCLVFSSCGEGVFSLSS